MYVCTEYARIYILSYILIPVSLMHARRRGSANSGGAVDRIYISYPSQEYMYR